MHHIYEDERYFYIVMEHLQGGEVSKAFLWLKNKQFAFSYLNKF